MSSSSSTTRISDAISDPFLLILNAFLTQIPLDERESQRDFRALTALPITERDLAAMVLHDLAHDRQSQARALGAGGDIGLGQPMAMFRRQADAIVAYLEREIDAI